MNKKLDILKKYNEKYALSSFQNIEDKIIINFFIKENKNARSKNNNTK